MPVIFRLAFRNIREHASKSLIIGFLLAFGALILVVGNAFIDASAMGIRKTFSDNYTGDIFISGVSEEGAVSLFGVTSPGGLAETPLIPEFDKTIAILQSNPHIKAFSPLATGFAQVTRGDLPRPENAETSSSSPQDRFFFLFGVDAATYWQLFDSIEIAAGRRLQPGDRGLMVRESQLKKISAWLGKTLVPGDSLLVQGFSSAGFRLRELPIIGVFRQKEEGTTPEQLAYIDIESLRVMAGLTVGANENIQLQPEATNMLAVEDTDALFGDDLVMSEAVPAQSPDFNTITEQLSRKPEERTPIADEGAWQFIVVKTDNPARTRKTIVELNTSFAREGLPLVAGDWQKAAGPYGQSVDVVRIVFAAAIIILSIVAVIIITNTFVISVLERTSEIGTMRAIGAGKGFIRAMFAAEAVTLATFSALIGAVLGVLVTMALRALRIEATNQFFVILFGGQYMSPFVTLGNFAGAVLIMVLVGFIAHLYPVMLALRIQPVRAMQEE